MVYSYFLLRIFCIFNGGSSEVGNFDSGFSCLCSDRTSKSEALQQVFEIFYSKNVLFATYNTFNKWFTPGNLNFSKHQRILNNDDIIYKKNIEKIWVSSNKMLCSYWQS